MDPDHVVDVVDVLDAACLRGGPVAPDPDRFHQILRGPQHGGAAADPSADDRDGEDVIRHGRRTVSRRCLLSTAPEPEPERLLARRCTTASTPSIPRRVDGRCANLPY